MSVQLGAGSNLIGSVQQAEQLNNFAPAVPQLGTTPIVNDQTSTTAYAERIGIDPRVIATYRQLTLERSAIPPSAPPADKPVYIVQPGDSLSTIAARYGTTVDELLRLNPDITNPDLILVNQKLALPNANGSSRVALTNTLTAETGGPAGAPDSANGSVEPVVGNPISASASEIADSPDLQQELAWQFAPTFIFHPGETHLPANPDDYYGDGAVSIAEADHPGSANPADVPVPYQYSEGPPPTMTYWIFSPFNNAPGGNNPVANHYDHEGDWEAVTIEFDPVTMQPVNMRYSSHSTSETLPWDAVPKTQDAQGNWRPQVYVALGSHAMSPDTGTRGTDFSFVNDDFAEGDYRIDSQSQLENITTNSWFGVDTKWGTVDGPSKDKKNQITDDRSEVTGAASRADALIMYYTEYNPDGTLLSVDWEALAADAADENTETVRLIFKWSENLNWSGKEDERDEFAQAFVDALWIDDSNKDLGDYSDAEVEQTALYRFAESEAGRKMLVAMAKELAWGTDDEVADFEKIKIVLALHGIAMDDSGNAQNQDGSYI